MFSNSLKNILQHLAQQPGWEQYRQHQEVMECWSKIINPKIAQNTRPRFISRQILWVATSSSVWAQELSLQRYSLLKKLNSQLTFTLSDIRFSSVDWHKSSENLPLKKEDEVKKAKNLAISAKNKTFIDKKLENDPEINDPKIALQKWLKNLKNRADSPTIPFFPCPQCGSPTPASELERWQVCCHCVADKWSLEYRLPNQNNHK